MVSFRLSTAVVLLCLAAIATASPVGLNKQCVLSDTGRQTCKYFSGYVMDTSVRQDMGCDANDIDCMAVESLVYVNDVRRKYNKPPLKMGSKSMLSNAMQHSRDMMGRGSLYHQDLGDVTGKIGCGYFCSGENVAMHGRGFGNGSPAKVCVDQWEGSSGHLKNILSDYSEYTMIAIYVTSGSNWCTQTFSKMTDESKYKGPSCEPVSDVSAGSGPTPTEPTEPMTTTTKAPAPMTTTTKAPAPMTTTTKKPAPMTTTTKAPAPTTTTTMKPAPMTTTTKAPAPMTEATMATEPKMMKTTTTPAMGDESPVTGEDKDMKGDMDKDMGGDEDTDSAHDSWKKRMEKHLCEKYGWCNIVWVYKR